MQGVNPEALEFALSKIDEGFVFESFAQSFLSAILGYTFLPVGGLHDKGIDGLEHTFQRNGNSKQIYQISIQKSVEAKINDTFKALKDNNIIYDSLILVTNQNVTNKDTLIDKFYDEFAKNLRIFDIKWFSTNVNQNQSAINAYHTFVENNIHEFNKPSKSFYVGNIVDDPRLFVYLKHQWDENKNTLKLNSILADTLILFALEGTDPDKKIFRTSDEIRKAIKNYIKFDPKLLYPIIDERLVALSKKPRKIQFHLQSNAYCLPYETRLAITERNIINEKLYENFKNSTENNLKKYLSNSRIVVKEPLALIDKIINKIYYQQGLDFANFILQGDSEKSFEKDLPSIISNVVDESAVVVKNREAVKNALMITIREIVYNGTAEQKTFLRNLSNTYMMLFLLQCDPKIATYFNSLASKLKVYVCNSLIIPALSEFYLESYNRRHWNLLKGSQNAGVTLIVNDTILKELVSHFRRIITVYDDIYKDKEEIYLNNEFQALYVDEILIRAYFYAKLKNQVSNFAEFIDNFVSPSLYNAESSLAEWLNHEFGIVYQSDESLGVEIDRAEFNLLTAELTKEKKNETLAKRDSKLILTINRLRAVRNETGSNSIIGYKTWWLSKDTLTQKSVEKVFGDKYNISCYLRPDFLYNYISLAPTKTEVDSTYEEIFPSLIGVNISFNLPSDIMKVIQSRIAEHSKKNPARLKSALKEMGEKLKLDSTMRNKVKLESFLDSLLKTKPRSMRKSNK